MTFSGRCRTYPSWSTFERRRTNAQDQFRSRIIISHSIRCACQKRTRPQHQAEGPNMIQKCSRDSELVIIVQLMIDEMQEAWREEDAKNVLELLLDDDVQMQSTCWGVQGDIEEHWSEGNSIFSVSISCCRSSVINERSLQEQVFWISYSRGEK